ncbi:hypothetical protein GH714_001709 [Hevea brasiliensis]|uniref:Transposase MuDR plant domain-containing protein n=1 Tax=Hevea brasiliensis TaxID=3981 RepID=A0A6A6NFD6_HEVBR|nr:hypothetical protein GH714_001709 [Hevea brasiliensis]
MVFANNHEFKEACKEYGIKHRYQIHFPTNDKKRVKATHFKKCGWYIWASKLNPKDPTYMSMQIKSRKFEHACGKVFTNFHITSKWLASHYLEIFRHDPDWSIPGIITRVKAYTLTINPIKAWRARELALKAINGDEAVQYGRYILDTGNKAIITMLEMIRNKLMTKLFKKRDMKQKDSSQTPPMPTRATQETLHD